MNTDILNNDIFTLLLKAVFGGGGLVVCGRWAFSWLSKQNLTDTVTVNQKDLIGNLKAEAKKWEDRYDASEKDHSDSRKQHESTLILLGEVRNQNKMLRMLLIQRGMSAEELDKALEVQE
jgi:hypothetical protein